MKTLTGTTTMIRLAVRRDRIMVSVWCYAFLAICAGSAYAAGKLYATATAREQVANGLGHDPALVALYGQPFDLGTQGGLDTWKIAGFGAVATGLMSLMSIVRHTRAEENAGRAELLGAGVLGRRARLTAALAITALANLAVLLSSTIGLIIGGLPVGRSILFAATLASVGLTFAAVAAVTAQLAETGRGANGLAAAVLAATYLLRALGDAAGPTGPRWLSWLSPIGWSQRIRPYGAMHWWLFSLPIAATLLLAATGYALADRRDLGAGLLPARPGRPHAGRNLVGAGTLAWRLHRGSLLGWACACAIGGLAIGSIANSIGDLVNSSPQMATAISKMGGQHRLVDAFLATICGLLGPIVAIYAVQASVRPRVEETGQLAEPILATATGRIRWLASHLTCAVLGTAGLLTVAGLAIGFSFGLTVGDVTAQLPRVLGATVEQLPAALVLAGLTVALFGLLPRLVAAAWALIGLFLLINLLGPALNLDQWAMDISPFTHVSKLPGGQFAMTPLVWLSLIAIGLAALGLVGFRRRDVG